MQSPGEPSQARGAPAGSGDVGTPFALLGSDQAARALPDAVVRAGFDTRSRHRAVLFDGGSILRSERLFPSRMGVTRLGNYCYSRA